MTRVRPRLASLMFVTLLLSLISFGVPWISVVTAGKVRLAATATIAIVALVLSFATVALAIEVHRKRGLWSPLWRFQHFFGPRSNYHS
jgi:amino acid transporter